MHLEQKLGSVKLHFVCWVTGWSKSSEAVWFLSIEQFGGWLLEVTGGWYEKKSAMPKRNKALGYLNKGHF